AAAARAKDLHRTIRVDAVGPAAVSDECLFLRKLLEALLEFVDRHRVRPRDVAGGVLPRRPGVEDDDVAGAATPPQLLDRHCLGFRAISELLAHDPLQLGE